MRTFSVKLVMVTIEKMVMLNIGRVSADKASIDGLTYGEATGVMEKITNSFTI